MDPIPDGQKGPVEPPQGPEIKDVQHLCFPDADIHILAQGGHGETHRYRFQLHKTVLAAYSRVFGDMAQLGDVHNVSQRDSSEPPQIAQVVLEDPGPHLVEVFAFMYAARIPNYELWSFATSGEWPLLCDPRIKKLLEMLILADKYGIENLVSTSLPILMANILQANVQFVQYVGDSTGQFESFNATDAVKCFGVCMRLLNFAVHTNKKALRYGCLEYSKRLVDYWDEGSALNNGDSDEGLALLSGEAAVVFWRYHYECIARQECIDAASAAAASL